MGSVERRKKRKMTNVCWCVWVGNSVRTKIKPKGPDHSYREKGVQEFQFHPLER